MNSEYGVDAHVASFRHPAPENANSIDTGNHQRAQVSFFDGAGCMRHR
jgi:hypothetical protein